MPLTTAGRNYMANAIVANPATLFDTANAHIGVGDSAVGFLDTHTNLQAVTNKLRKVVDSAPGFGTNVATFVSTFSTSEANWAWQEWGIFNHVSTGTMLCRKVESLGTKTSAQSWQITATITVSIGT